MSTVDLTNPAGVMQELRDIEQDLARRQNGYETAARAWFSAKPQIERERVKAMLSADANSVAEKRAAGELAALSAEGVEFQAEYESLRAVIGVLESRATICMSILKAQGRA